MRAVGMGSADPERRPLAVQAQLDPPALHHRRLGLPWLSEQRGVAYVEPTLAYRLICGCAAALAGKATLSADAYPSRVITMVVPYAAGGPSDTVARLLAEPMTRGLGQQVIVENVGGASGTIGAARVARADPDGYTILLHTSAHATNTLLYRKLRFDAAADFAPVADHDRADDGGGQEDLPPNSAAELLEHIRANPEKITIGNAGVGGPSHLCGMLLMSRLDTPMITVPYKGAARRFRPTCWVARST